MRLIRDWGSNYYPAIIVGYFYVPRRKMETGRLYFVKDEFYDRFKNFGLLENKEVVNGKEHNRPCCYALKFTKNDAGIYWMIPISSKITKYETEYQKSIAKYGICDNISFGYVLGQKCAFLPQNLFPVTEEYIKNVYLDKNTSLPITVPADLMAELNKKARKKIRYNQQGKKLGMSDTVKIYNELMKSLENKDAAR